jgi:hypothetical protein
MSGSSVDRETKCELDFFDRDGVLLANFDAAFASEAFFLVHWVCLTVDQFINIHGTYIDTFAITNTLVFVNRYFPHFFPPSSLELIIVFGAWLNRGDKPFRPASLAWDAPFVSSSQGNVKSNSVGFLRHFLNL